MKNKILLLSLVFTTLLFSSCKEIDKVIDDLRNLNDIPANADIELSYLPINLFEIPVSVSLDLRQVLENSLGTGEVLNQVKEVELDDLVVELIECDNRENFDFIESVILGVKTDDLEYVEVAKLDEVPKGQTSIKLETIDGLYVDEYAKSESLKVVITVKSVKDARKLKIKLKMKFDAKIAISLK